MGGRGVQPGPAPPDENARFQESLKIFHQYARLLAQACHSSHHQDQHLPAHAQCLSSRPSVYPKPLEWFEHLASPFKGIPDASHARIDQLLKLYAAGSEHPPGCPAKQASELARSLPHSASPARTPAKQAFELARSLPHYDRDLTAFYLISSQTLPANEYELEVAHSILRLHQPPSLAALCQHLLAWRTQGLLHVLTVAVHNMPELADWHLPLGNDPAKAQHIRFLLSHFLTDGVQAIERYIAACDPNSPTDQAFLAILDRLAILMGVKSNAKDETGHSLAQALASFPHLDLLVPASTVEAWSRLKPALELAIPPSLLRVDPAIARKRAKQGIEGTW